MSVYMTEEEQLEAIKRWWNNNGTWVTVVLAAILIAVSAYRYWNWHEEKITAQASNTYEHMLIAFSNKDIKATRSYAKELMTNYDKTVYADAARMVVAKLMVAHEHFDKAELLLETVVKNSKMSALRQIARIRVARLLAAQKEYDHALGELNTVDNNAYMPVINELKGDIFAATGHMQQAIISYKEAIAEVKTQGMGNLFLEMKTNELAALSQQTNEASTTQAA